MEGWRHNIRNPQFEKETDWCKNRQLVHDGFKDLEYLPRSRTGWNATLAAHAYSARRQIAFSFSPPPRGGTQGGVADLNLWAAMHGCPASARYSELEENALVLWHGTSAKRAAQIAQFGLFHKRGLWTTLEPRIAHGYARGRGSEYRAGSATVVLLLDRREIKPGIDYELDSPEIFRFHTGLPPEHIEYILWDDRVEFMGERKAEWPKPWGVARFKKREGRWMPLSQPPVRFDDEHTYGDIAEWLHLSVQRILSTLGSVAAIEIFSSLYATIHPWEALMHEEIFKALEHLCGEPRQRHRFKQFSLGMEVRG